MTELNFISSKMDLPNSLGPILSALDSVNPLLRLESAFLGLLDFQKSVLMQQELSCLAQKSRCHYVIGLEHPALLTLGYRAERSLEVLPHSTLPIQSTTRGGLATIHSEGQLVIYPVMNLKELNLGVKEYVSLLLTTTQDLLGFLNIDSYIDTKAVGLYTHYGKLAFCGIQIKNGVSQHGLSLNVRNDLSLFSEIRACGCENAKFDSLSRYGVTHTLSELYQIWIRIFEKKLKAI